MCCAEQVLNLRDLSSNVLQRRGREANWAATMTSARAARKNVIERACRIPWSCVGVAHVSCLPAIRGLSRDEQVHAISPPLARHRRRDYGRSPTREPTSPRRRGHHHSRGRRERPFCKRRRGDRGRIYPQTAGPTDPEEVDSPGPGPIDRGVTEAVVQGGSEVANTSSCASRSISSTKLNFQYGPLPVQGSALGKSQQKTPPL